MKKQEGTLEIKYSPSVVAHRAAFQLCEGRGGRELHNEVGVQYRLTDVTQQKDPVITPFKVSNCESEEPTEVGLKSPYGLYERQQKVVSKMLAVERMETDFEEVELSEQEIPSCGISLIAKATRNRKIRGGVIADAIGSGKTVVSIAMILNGLANARKSGELPNRSGATLVVVPPALIDQWASEIRKFSPVHLNVIKIYDFKTLRSKSVQSIIASDVVICPIDILESPGYMECLVKSANLKDMKEVPTLPSHSGQIEQSEARGVWIPATSADPYAGANNSNNQKRRNQSAYYTFVYLQAIEELRKQKFGESTKGVPLEVRMPSPRTYVCDLYLT